MKHFSIFSHLLFLFFAQLIFSLPVQAGHIAGAELTYTHLVGNMYRIHLSLYRDCTGIPAPNSVDVSLESVTCQDSTSFTLQPIANTGNEILNPCPGHATTCNGGNEPGIEKWEYEADVAITSQCSDWIFTYQVCCIGGNVQQSDLIVKSLLNNFFSDNNSPQFTNNPFFFNLCINEDNHFNNGMFDPDGDSLASRLINLPGATYIVPYSGKQPFTSVPPITMDSVSGNFLGHPTTIEVGWIAYQILDYRNGTQVGSVMRAVIYYTLPCTNQLPIASGMNGTTQDSIFVFPNDTVCFDILSDDADNGQEVTLSWDQAIPTATFDTAGGPHPTGTFCWTPTLNDVWLHPHVFTVKVEDNNCPKHGAGIFGYRIYVTLDSSLVWTSGNEIGINDDIFIYPNPTDGNFSLNKTENISSIKIFDYSGKVIQAFKPEEQHLALDVPGGVYWFEIIYNDGRRSSRKLIVKN